MSKGRAKVLEEFNYFQNNYDPNSLFFVNFWDDTLDNPNVMEWKITLIPAKGTLYEDGYFSLKAKFDENYPDTRPIINFRTRIYHLNIHESTGSICINILNYWKNQPLQSRNMQYVLDCINALLYLENINDPYKDGKEILYKNNIDEYKKKCREYVKKYANPDDFDNFAKQGML